MLVESQQEKYQNVMNAATDAFVNFELNPYHAICFTHIEPVS